MLKDFENWYSELVSDERWFEQASMHYRIETFKSVAHKVYVNGITDLPAFSSCPMTHHRQHVYNKLTKLTPDKPKKPWWDKPKEEVKPIHPPLTGEARQKRLQEFLEMVEKAPMMKPIPKPSSREILENGDWRPKPDTIHEPSEVEKRIAYLEHLQTVRECRMRVFREAYPDASPEELKAYLDKFSEIDNPLGL